LCEGEMKYVNIVYLVKVTDGTENMNCFFTHIWGIFSFLANILISKLLGAF